MSTPPSQLIAAWLRGYMAARDIPHAEAARVVGMVQQAFSRRMNGQTPFTIDELTTLVSAYGIDYVKMIDGARALDGQIRRSDVPQKTVDGEDDAVDITLELDPPRRTQPKRGRPREPHGPDR